jgi:hypothetical protein
MKRTVFLTCLAWLCAGPALAQTSTPPPPGARSLELGPLSMRPRLDVREIGIDDNVFNDPDNPQSDFTAVIAPRLEATLRLGWTRLITATAVEFVYFKDFVDERSVNRAVEGRFEVGEGILRPFVLGSALDTNERPNAEIDARAGRRQLAYGGGLDVALTSRTMMTTLARRSTVDFDEGVRYRGVELSRTLDSQIDLFEGGLRVAITPLTTWMVTGGVQQERFERDPLRDSDRLRFVTGLQFSPSALISGNASVGYQRFTPQSELLAEYQGLIAQVGLTYAVESTRLEGQVERDVRYSFEELQPYYVVTNLRLVVTERIAGPVDVQGTIGRHLMAYRELGGSADVARRDKALVYGGGLGYRVGATARLGVNLEWTRRRSDTREDRHYDRRRLYGTLSYGF